MDSSRRMHSGPRLRRGEIPVIRSVGGRSRGELEPIRQSVGRNLLGSPCHLPPAGTRPQAVDDCDTYRRQLKDADCSRSTRRMVFAQKMCADPRVSTLSSSSFSWPPSTRQAGDHRSRCVTPWWRHRHSVLSRHSARRSPKHRYVRSGGSPLASDLSRCLGRISGIRHARCGNR